MPWGPLPSQAEAGRGLGGTALRVHRDHPAAFEGSGTVLLRARVPEAVDTSIVAKEVVTFCCKEVCARHQCRHTNGAIPSGPEPSFLYASMATTATAGSSTMSHKGIPSANLHPNILIHDPKGSPQHVDYQ